MLRKETVIDRLEILETGHIQVRRARYFLEDDVRVSGPQYIRYTYAPGDDVSAEDPKVRAVAAAVWTQKVLEDYRITQRERS